MLKISALVHLNPLLPAVPCFSFELGQIKDLLALLEVMVKLPGKVDFRLLQPGTKQWTSLLDSPLQAQAVDCFKTSAASALGGMCVEKEFEFRCASQKARAELEAQKT